MPNPQTLLEAVYRYEAEHGRAAAEQLLAEAWKAAVSPSALERPARLRRSTDRGGDTFKEEIYARCNDHVDLSGNTQAAETVSAVEPAAVLVLRSLPVVP